MVIKKLYQADMFPRHMVVETVEGKYKKFYISPARRITEKDLTPLAVWFHAGNYSKEAGPYMYKLYGLKKT